MTTLALRLDRWLHGKYTAILLKLKRYIGFYEPFLDSTTHLGLYMNALCPGGTIKRFRGVK